MKRKILLGMLTLVLTICCMGLVACGNSGNASKNTPHVHNFNQEITIDKYLLSNATCEEGAKYYYSCTCGEKGTESFVDGKKLFHEYSNWVSNGDGTHSRICSNDNTHIQTRKCVGGQATCTEKAICLSCGVAYGDYKHTLDSEYKYDETHHWQESTCECNVIQNYNKHTLDADGFCNICKKVILSTEGVIYDVSKDGTYAEVIGYNGTSNRVRIADTYKNLPVKNIFSSSFMNCLIKEIVIPDSITIIGDHAFAYCYLLTNITMSNSITSIGNYAFLCCNSLMNISIPNSITSMGEAVFGRCDRLNFNLKNNLRYLGNKQNPYLVLIYADDTTCLSYQIENKTAVIADGAFNECITCKSIAIPNSVIYIDDYCFIYCKRLTTIYCEAENKPSSWDTNWSYGCSAEIVWGYKG